jgi:hypothetical protein
LQSLWADGWFVRGVLGLIRCAVAKDELHHHDDPDLDDGHHSDDERAVAAGAAAPASPEQPPRSIDHLAAPQQAQPAAAAPAAAAPAAVAALPVRLCCVCCVGSVLSHPLFGCFSGWQAVQVQVQASAAAPSTFG